jgi:DNA-binding CsgD family transcriptional regulator
MEARAAVKNARRPIDRIRELCLLGLDRASLAAELFESLRQLSPIHIMELRLCPKPTRNPQLVRPEHYQTFGYFDPPSLKTRLQPFVERAERWHKHSFRPWFDWHWDPDTHIVRCLNQVLAIEVADFVSDPFFTEFSQELLAVNNVRVLQVCDQGLTLGYLALASPSESAGLTCALEQALAELRPSLFHGFANDREWPGLWTDVDDEGLLILSSEGQVRCASPSAKRLLGDIFSLGNYSVQRWRCVDHQELSAKLTRLCCTVATDVSDTHGTWNFQNELGRFTFRTHRIPFLTDESETSMVAITIRRQAPLPLTLLKRLDLLPALSRRERQICLRVTQGEVYDEIAQSLTLSKRTVIAHMQNIFNKLNVENRTELINLLLLELTGN